MLLNNYTLEIKNNHCMPGATSVHCIASLDTDVGPALPYLNAELGGDVYTVDPPSVTFKSQGKLITVHAWKIAVNALKDKDEAVQIVEWLKREINSAWENRHDITPRYTAAVTPKLIEILKLLPRTNCRDCGQPTCMVFAALVVEGGKGPEDCPALDTEHRGALQAYLRPFGELDGPAAE